MGLPHEVHVKCRQSTGSIWVAPSLPLMPSGAKQTHRLPLGLSCPHESCHSSATECISELRTWLAASDAIVTPKTEALTAVSALNLGKGWQGPGRGYLGGPNSGEGWEKGGGVGGLLGASSLARFSLSWVSCHPVSMLCAIQQSLSSCPVAGC